MIDTKISDLLERNNKDGVRSKAIKEIGLTSDFREAGYILEDGKMLDFSGKRDGGEPRTRNMDHREICRALDTGDKGATGDQCLEVFTRRNNIRFGMTQFKPDINIDLNTYQTPTDKQKRTLQNGFLVCKRLNQSQSERFKCNVAYDVWNNDLSRCQSEYIDNAPANTINYVLEQHSKCKTTDKSMV